MAEVVTLAEAVAELVRDGDTVALEGFTHLIPHAAGHELIRQGRRDLTLVRMTPDLVYDQLIGMGCARKLVFSWGGNPGVGSLHRLRDAVEHELAGPARARGALARGHGGRLRGGRREPAVRRRSAATTAPICRRTRGSGGSRARSPARSSRPFPRIGPTSGSSTRSRPTGTATSSSGGSPACRRRPCSPRRARS